VTGADVAFDDTIAHLRELFAEGRPIIGICASGILIRALATLLGSKTEEPPVIAISQDGSAVVPLLGGHHGANRMAKQIADLLGIQPAITTASDASFGIALDDPPNGYHLLNPDSLKPFAAKLLAGEKIKTINSPPWIADSDLVFSDNGSLDLEFDISNQTGEPNRLVYAEEVLALGVGCERGCDADELNLLVRSTLIEANLAPEAIAVVVSLDLKCDEPALASLSAELDRPLRFFDAARLETETPRIANPSATVFRAVGCHGVAESAALAAAGEDGSLILEKRKSKRATCAIARAPHLIDVGGIGRAKGSLAVVGLGPGATEWRTGEARNLIAKASDIVGYRGYLDQLGSIANQKTLHPYALGEETERVDTALDLAAEGKQVALISSGDPGIYAMAALVFERLDEIAKPTWHWADVTVSPGISALQAAAARIGAPLGHDFCAISLSDLLTSEEIIEQRLQAAATGDFVVALYNPASKTRRALLQTAIDCLSAHRPKDTPIVVARQLGRPEENVKVETLQSLDLEMVDMFTLLLIGSSQTRAIADKTGVRWVYTPRGYKSKKSSKRVAS
ncbi:MAG TPA: precorrin-3B C(17)-methyltransferase, partial [Rhodospirillaceae bacterium]|nr:precorrin-3B C(17)-methyltransferase [Rhodospirillaceae bacterium]